MMHSYYEMKSIHVYNMLKVHLKIIDVYNNFFEFFFDMKQNEIFTVVEKKTVFFLLHP